MHKYRIFVYIYNKNVVIVLLSINVFITLLELIIEKHLLTILLKLYDKVSDFNEHIKILSEKYFEMEHEYKNDEKTVTLWENYYT